MKKSVVDDRITVSYVHKYQKKTLLVMCRWVVA
jgi:hypothetical protein